MNNIKPAWYRSLAFQLSVALLLLFGTSAWLSISTLYQTTLRKHDYAILDLTGQLRVLAHTMTTQSQQYLNQSRSDNSGLFRSSLASQRDLYNRIIISFKTRNLDPELTGLTEPLRCSWDAQSIAQLDLTAERWAAVAGRLNTLLDDQADNLKVAEYISGKQDELVTISKDLNDAFRRMMEGKQHLIVVTTQIATGVSLLFVIVLMVLLYTTFVRPLRKTMTGFARVAQGDLGYQVPLHLDNEIGYMADSFNRLSSRLHALFRLTDRINQATRLDQSLQFVSEEFSDMLPLDWVGLLTRDSSGQHFLLDRMHTALPTQLREGDLFTAEGSLLTQALGTNKPLNISDLARLTRESPATEFAAALQRDGLQSALFFPLSNEKQWSAVIAFASCSANAYSEEHLELLHNIAAQVSHSFEKTVVTENLIVSAVSGLAKLAENRDPETGDHLVRMTRYSVLIAEALRSDPTYADQISAEFIRDLDRFAAMHDIGKVGIEDNVLLKPGRLDPEERRIMERHPSIGGEVLRRCEEQMNSVGHSIFQVGIEIAECHHEKYDGSGYPQGMQGTAIPLSARIVAAADVFDALTSKRPYKEAWPVDKALSVMREDSGKHFDPDIIAAMEKCLPDMLQVYERLKHV